MALIDNLKGIGELATGLASGFKTVFETVRGKSVLTAEQEADLQMKLAELAQKAQEAENTIALAQANIALEEAKSAKLFISGARPFILWICGSVVLYTYVVSPILKACGVGVPDMAMSDLWPVITGMLGLGAYRTYEKSKGVVGTH
jgi:hypothetical protein